MRIATSTIYDNQVSSIDTLVAAQQRYGAQLLRENTQRAVGRSDRYRTGPLAPHVHRARESGLAKHSECERAVHDG